MRLDTALPFDNVVGVDDTLLGLMALNLAESVTYDTYRALIERYGSVRMALAAPEEDLVKSPGIGPKTARRLRTLSNSDEAVREVEEARDIGLDIITCEDERYPHNLRFIDDRPIVLYVRGELTAADAQALSIVGSRRCTIYGKEQARRFAGELAAMGFTIVSGLAYGIDKAAHEAALDAGGRTIAVLGSGFVRFHPRGHEELAERIAKQGAVISEWPLDSAALDWHFPRRNRLVSGLSLGVIVVEAARQSGALITAGLAAQQGKEVFALPGRVTDCQSWGALDLIRDGAKLVCNPADVVAEFPDLASAIRSERLEQVDRAVIPELGEAERRIWDLLSNEPKHIDELIAGCEMTASQVLSTLLMLEVKRVVRQHPGKFFTRT